MTPAPAVQPSGAVAHHQARARLQPLRAVAELQHHARRAAQVPPAALPPHWFAPPGPPPAGWPGCAHQGRRLARRGCPPRRLAALRFPLPLRSKLCAAVRISGFLTHKQPAAPLRQPHGCRLVLGVLALWDPRTPHRPLRPAARRWRRHQRPRHWGQTLADPHAARRAPSPAARRQL